MRVYLKDKKINQYIKLWKPPLFLEIFPHRIHNMEEKIEEQKLFNKKKRTNKSNKNCKINFINKKIGRLKDHTKKKKHIITVNSKQ